MSAGVPLSQDNNVCSTTKGIKTANEDMPMQCMQLNVADSYPTTASARMVNKYIITNDADGYVNLYDHNGILIEKFLTGWHDLNIPSEFKFILTIGTGDMKKLMMVEYIFSDDCYEKNIIAEFDMHVSGIVNVFKFIDYTYPNKIGGIIDVIDANEPKNHTLIQYNRNGFEKTVSVRDCITAFQAPTVTNSPFFMWGTHGNPRKTIIYDSNLHIIFKKEDIRAIIPVNNTQPHEYIFIHTDTGEYYKIAPYKIPEDELCVDCMSARMTTNKVLSCGHRNYCDDCIRDTTVCKICKKEDVSVIIIH